MKRGIRRWYAEQWAEPEDAEPVCGDATLPPDAGMSTVEYAVGTEYGNPTVRVDEGQDTRRTRPVVVHIRIDRINHF